MDVLTQIRQRKTPKGDPVWFIDNIGDKSKIE